MEKKHYKQLILIVVVFVFVILLSMQILNILTLDNLIYILTFLAVGLSVYYFFKMYNSKQTTKVEKTKVIKYVFVYIIAVIFWSLEEQMQTVIADFAVKHAGNNIGFFHFPASTYQVLNPLLILIYSAIFAVVWSKIRHINNYLKISVGLIISGLAYIVMFYIESHYSAQLNAHSIRVSPFWIILFFGVFMVSEVLISPIGIALTNKLSPKAFSSQMMGMWFLSDAVGQTFNAVFVNLYNSNPKLYFGLMSLSGIILGLVGVLIVINTKALHDEE
jgi:POT family proton-dependent oligopeptide transporter